MDMSNPMPYLLSDAEGDSAPYWYFRHGMKDRDTSFDVPVALYYAVLNASDVEQRELQSRVAEAPLGRLRRAGGL